MPVKPVNLSGVTSGRIVNREVVCDQNPACPGIRAEDNGMVDLPRFSQKHYEHAPPPACPYCNHKMSIVRLTAVPTGHVSKADKVKQQDQVMKMIFEDAERNSIKLPENSREGDRAKAAVISGSAAEFMNTMTPAAQASNMHIGFGAQGRTLQERQKNVQMALQGSSTLANETRRLTNGAMPMDQLAAATGNSRFWSRNNLKFNKG